jgi:hypothetical protein
MSVNLDGLTTTNEVDVAILEMVTLKAEYEFRKTTIERQIDFAEGVSDSIPKDITQVQFELIGLREMYQESPDGPDKISLGTLIDDKEQDLKSLEDKEKSYGFQATRFKDFELVSFDQVISSIVQYKADLEAYKLQLAA